MALLKSKVNPEDRNKLFYNKFNYRSAITAKYLNFIYYTDDIEEFKAKLASQVRRSTSFGRKVNPMECNYVVIDKIIKFRNKYRKSKECIIRLEYNKICVFSNNIKILNEIYNIDKNAVLTQAVNPSEPGVLLFARQPEFKFRTFIKNKKVSSDFKETLMGFLDAHPYLKPCGALKNRLNDPKVTTNFGYLGFGTYFIDYNDDAMLTYFHLVFPEVVGKTYKLEKRTG